MTARKAVSYRDLVRSVPEMRRLWPALAVSWLGDAVQSVALIWLASGGPAPAARTSALVLFLWRPPRS